MYIAQMIHLTASADAQAAPRNTLAASALTTRDSPTSFAEAAASTAKQDVIGDDHGREHGSGQDG